MKDKIDVAIGNLLAMVRTNCKPDEALKFTQAALNLAHVKGTLAAIELHPDHAKAMERLRDHGTKASETSAVENHDPKVPKPKGAGA